VHHESALRLARLREALGDTVPDSLGAIRAVSDDASAALDDYLDHHGYWLAEDRIAGPLLVHFPSAIIQSIRTAKHPGDIPPIATRVAALRNQVPADKRDEFNRLATDAHEAYKMLDDNSGILAAWACGVTARDLREAAGRLVETGQLANAEQVWVLTSQEVIDLLGGATSPSTDSIETAFARWKANASLNPPSDLNGTPSPPPDPSVFPDPVAGLVAAMGAFLNDKFNGAGSTIGIGDHQVTGRAVVVDAPSEALDRIQPGDILVTTATTPAYNAILGIVGGIVVSTGGPSSHAAVVAREMGTPAIVGYPDATTAIADGSTITLDPSAATVTTVPG
jgi:pyruvate,water dikinase